MNLDLTLNELQLLEEGIAAIISESERRRADTYKTSQSAILNNQNLTDRVNLGNKIDALRVLNARLIQTRQNQPAPAPAQEENNTQES